MQVHHAFRNRESAVTGNQTEEPPIRASAQGDIKHVLQRMKAGQSTWQKSHGLARTSGLPAIASVLPGEPYPC